MLTLALFNVTVQLSTPRWVVGRAMSLYQMATFGGMALGSWIWGLVAEGYGPGEALLASAALMLVGAALGLWIKLPEHAALNLDPLNRWREPNLALDLKPRSGPIVISIEYVIREEDLHDFLDAMAERRRIRRRDGARQWTLKRDLENPKSGSRPITRRPGTNISGTICARPMRTPWWGTGCGNSTAEPSRRKCAA